MRTPNSIPYPAIAEFLSSNLPNYCLSVQLFPSHLSQDPVEMAFSLLSRVPKDPSFARFCRTHEGAKRFFGFAVKCLAEEYDQVEKVLKDVSFLNFSFPLSPFSLPPFRRLPLPSLAEADSYLSHSSLLSQDSLNSMGFSCRIDNLSDVAVRIIADSDPSLPIQSFLSTIPSVVLPVLRKYTQLHASSKALPPSTSRPNPYRTNLINAVANGTSLAALVVDPSKVGIIREISVPSVWAECLGKNFGGCVPGGEDDLKACGKVSSPPFSSHRRLDVFSSSLRFLWFQCFAVRFCGTVSHA